MDKKIVEKFEELDEKINEIKNICVNIFAILLKSNNNNNFNLKKIKGVEKMQKGSISKRKDGRYMGRYYDAIGKQKCVYSKTKSDCLKLLKFEIQKVEEIKRTAKSLVGDLTLKQWWERYFEKFKKPLIKESSSIIFDKKIKSFFRDNEKLANTTLININSELIENALSNVSTFGNKTNILNLLKQCFEKAKDLGHIGSNPCANVILDKKEAVKAKKDERIKHLTAEQQELIYNKIKDEESKIVFLFLINTGLRIGELLGLTYNDIDFENNEIVVNKQFNTTTKKISETKSNKGNRKVPLFENLKKELIEKGYCKKSEEIIFKKKKSVYETSIVKNCFDFKYSFHTFRKTFASRCQLEFGISPKIVQEWLGHEKITTTDEFYTFANDKMIADSVELINNFYAQN